MSTAPIRQVVRGPHAGKLAVVVHENTQTGMLSARVAPAVGDAAPNAFDHRLPIYLFQPSYLKPL